MRRDLVPLLEWRPVECTQGGRRQVSFILMNGTYAFQETVRFPKIFGFLVGDNEIKKYYLLAPESVSVDWWIANGADPAWLCDNPYGEGTWCTVPQDLEKAIDLEFALRQLIPQAPAVANKGE